jgi:hypothetical protein
VKGELPTLSDETGIEIDESGAEKDTLIGASVPSPADRNVTPAGKEPIPPDVND